MADVMTAYLRKTVEIQRYTVSYSISTVLRIILYHTVSLLFYVRSHNVGRRPYSSACDDDRCMCG